MTEQQHDTTATQAPPPGPRTGPRVSGADVRDLGRLRRSSWDRKVAGVAGGIGRHLDVDPTVVRVALVVLTLFGGAGLILYVALWLFVPRDDRDHAVIRLGSELQSVVVIVALAVAGAVFLGNTFSNDGWGIGFPLVAVLILTAGIYLAVRDRRDTRDRLATGTPPAQTPTPQPAPAEGAAMSTTYPSAPDAPDQAPPPPAWMPPAGPAYVPPPPRPRRRGPVLFWPTLALIAIALGTLGIVDAGSSVAPSAYLALALAVIGAVLVVGAFVGRAGGLIALGLLTAFAMVVSTGVDAATGGATEQRALEATPTSAAAVDAEYRVQNGSLLVDLRQVTDLQDLDGRIVTTRLNAGEITVKVPRGLAVHVVADIRYAGHVQVGDQVREGFHPRLDTTLPAVPSTEAGGTTPTLELVARARVGSIDVEQD